MVKGVQIFGALLAILGLAGLIVCIPMVATPGEKIGQGLNMVSGFAGAIPSGVLLVVGVWLFSKHSGSVENTRTLERRSAKKRLFFPALASTSLSVVVLLATYGGLKNDWQALFSMPCIVPSVMFLAIGIWFLIGAILPMYKK